MRTARQPIPARESTADLAFPVCGIDVSCAFGSQKRRPTPDGSYGSTTPLGVNVRTYEPATNRARGGSRPGLSKYVSAQLAGGAPVQELATVVGVGYADPAGGAQTSQSGRIVTLVAVAGGNVYVTAPGGTSWTAATNNTGVNPPLISSGTVRSAQNGQKLFFADGVHQCYYDPTTNSVNTWSPTAGSLPVDKAGNTPRLICTWRGRTVLSGLKQDGQNWFMSAVSDPTNFDYSPFNQSPTQAIVGNSSPLGLVGDIVTSLVPYTDDILLFGGDHTLWRLAGDPLFGGQLGLVSDSIGLAWGVPWCKGPDGTVYFVSNKTGIYAVPPDGSPPQRISQQVEQLLVGTDTGANTIRLVWDDRFQGLHVFVTATAAQAAATHFFWEQRAGAWWQDVFANSAHNPLTTCVFDGNTPGDRRPLLGAWDGYVRFLDPAGTTDDGTAIASSVVLGPMLTRDLDMVLWKNVQAVLSTGSGSVAYAVYVGSTAEAALATVPAVSGTWGPGRNLTSHVRRSGHALYIKLSSAVPWAFENVRATIQGQGRVQRRGA